MEKEFSKELFGYNKAEVDKRINALEEKIAVLNGDLLYLKQENKKPEQKHQALS